MLANNSVLVVFVTSDWAQGMVNALTYVHKKVDAIKCNFISLKIPKALQGGRKERISYAANAIGTELKKRFIKFEDDFLFLELDIEKHSHAFNTGSGTPGAPWE